MHVKIGLDGSRVIRLPDIWCNFKPLNSAEIDQNRISDWIVDIAENKKNTSAFI